MARWTESETGGLNLDSFVEPELVRMKSFDGLKISAFVFRPDSVRDIGAIIEWVRQDNQCDGARIAVMGGSYGGYMVLASMIHFGDLLRCGADAVGSSNFLTFLENTQDHRRDLRRVEYGDERDPKMAEFLGRISPTAHAAKIRKPLFVAQGQNDPRRLRDGRSVSTRRTRGFGAFTSSIQACIADITRREPLPRCDRDPGAHFGGCVAGWTRARVRRRRHQQTRLAARAP